MRIGAPTVARGGIGRRIGGTGLLVWSVWLGGCGDGTRDPAAEAGAPGAGGPPAEVVLEAPKLASVGVDSAGMELALARAGELPQLRCVLVARHGEVEAERCFRGPGLDAYANVKSVSKSILSALVGIAIAEGHLTGPEQRILPYFSRYVGSDSEAAKGSITVGHLLSMQSGLERTSGAGYGRWVQSPDWVRYVITRPMIGEPGVQRLYSTGNSHLLSSIITQATGRSTWEFAREKLADPLGIRLPAWPTDPQGIYFGGNEMRLTPRALLRFGELYRNGGRHEDRQIVPEHWVRESLSGRARARSERESYGYGWFVSNAAGHEMFYAWGYGGQFIFIVPDLELTVVTTSAPDEPRNQGHNQAVRRLLTDYIVPAAERGREFAGT